MMTSTTTQQRPLAAQTSGVQKVRLRFDLYDGLRFWSAVTHGAGAVLGGIGGAALLVMAILRGASALDIVALSIFTASMVALYLASCLYHCINASARGRLFLRQMDHSMIYVLIAGTYTPVCLSVLGGALGWTLFGVIWGLAVLGVFVTLFWVNAPRTLTTMFYVGMGWIAVLAFQPLLAALPAVAVAWMLAGGVAYTVGGLLYALKWPLRNHPRFGCHEIFHRCVLLGSVCFFAMLWTIFAG